MATKIVAGLAMMVPAFAYHVYHNRQNGDTKTAVAETAKIWGFAAGFTSIFVCGYVGFVHLALGAYELSPIICPRE